MARYAVTEQANGDFLVHFPEGDKRLQARRDRANAMPAVAVTGERYSNEGKPAIFQVAFVTYRREDGVEVSGPYLGNCLEVLEP